MGLPQVESPPAHSAAVSRPRVESFLRVHWAPVAVLIWAIIFGAYEVVEQTLLADALTSTLYVLHILRGTATSFLLALFVAVYALGRATTEEATDERGVLLARALWLIRLRWIAILGVGAAIVVAHYGLGLLSAAALVGLWVIVGLMVAYNVGFALKTRQATKPRALAFAQLFMDLVSLTLLLHFGGGIENPFFSFFVFHVIIAGILLRRRECYFVATVACILFCGMVILGRAGVIGAYSLYGFPPLSTDYVVGILVAFVATTYFSTYFTTTIMGNLRQVTGELAREKSTLTDIVEGIGAALVVLDHNHDVVRLNEQGRRWFGDAAAGTRCHRAIWGSEERCPSCPAREAEQDGRPRSVERRLGDRHVMVTSTAVRGLDGEITHTLELIQDITVQKRIEEELMAAGKMAAVGQLASGIAHELNNPLASVAASAEYLKELVTDSDMADPLRRHLGRIEDSVYRCKDIIDALLSFARSGGMTVGPTDVNRSVLDTLRLVRGDARPELALCAPAPQAVANSRLLQQATLNLVLNAIEAAGPDGKVSVSTAADAGAVRIAVSDDGPGIDAELLPRVFEPFYTTKAVGQGTGLGLFLSHRAVEAMGGRIEAASEPGRGTRFTVILSPAAA